MVAGRQPDRLRIAAVRPPCPASDIYVVKANRTGLIQLTDDFGNNLFPGWSPDRDKVVFAHSPTTPPTPDTYDLYVMNADGTAPADLTSSPETRDLYPDWQSLQRD